jgi:hypothetical protein
MIQAHRLLADTSPMIKKNRGYPYLKSMIIYSRDMHKGKFNLRLYSFDTTHVMPLEELVRQNIVVETKSSLTAKPKPVEIDLSKYNIIFPETGILVCVEWLIIPENRYHVTSSYTDSKKKEVEIWYAPNLAATIDREGYMYQYKKGVWWKPIKNSKIPGYEWSECYFNPAISLKLTD